MTVHCVAEGNIVMDRDFEDDWIGFDVSFVSAIQASEKVVVYREDGQIATFTYVHKEEEENDEDE